MKQILIAITMLVSGLLLMAAAIDPGLPTGYWDSPRATQAEPPHAWLALEKDLRPEACAQCHGEQFSAWKESLHAHAYSSGLVGQFADMATEQELEEANSCLQCHAPLAEQMYQDGKDMADSIKLRLQHTEGFDRDVEQTDAGLSGERRLPLRHAGVTCASCHMRGWQRFGPPPRPSMAVGHQDRDTHGGFTATKDFEKSQFCASCHQFPQSMAINGKPLENTLAEWQASAFAKQGISCQQCHMPDRRHEFRGIHDPEMVRKGLEIDMEEKGGGVILHMTSKWIGHAFPTYVTPKIIVRAEALDAVGKTRQSWQWEIVREVYYDNGWQEKRDSRLMPGEGREFIATPLPDSATGVRFKVQVIPDYFYKGVYEGLLDGGLDGEVVSDAARHIRQALKHADGNDYLLYEKTLHLRATP